MSSSHAPPTCPRCGSDDVVEVVFGMPADPEGLAADPRARWGGCEPGDHHRECGECALAWLDVVGDAVLRTERELWEVADVGSRQELVDWISGKHELDAWLPSEPEGEGFAVAIGTAGTSIEFPITLRELLEALSELEDQAMISMEDDDEL